MALSAKEIETLIGELEIRLDRLRHLYEQYFLGYERLEPTVPRKDVDRRVDALRREQIRNTALRFRFTMTTQKYSTYQSYWQRLCRQIEEGTFKRHLQKAHLRFGSPKKALDRELEFEVSFDDDDDSTKIELEAELGGGLLGKTLNDAASATDIAAVAPRRALPPKPSVSMASAARPLVVRKESATPPARPIAPITPTAPAAPGATVPRLRPAGAPPPPPPPPPRPPGAAPPPPPAAAPPAAPPALRRPPPTSPSLRAASPVGASPTDSASMRAAAPASQRPVGAALKPHPMPAPPHQIIKRPSRPAPPIPSMVAKAEAGQIPETRMRELYEAYVDARRKRQESTDNVSFEAVKKSLTESTKQLAKSHDGKTVDFDVVEKDGKTVLKPRVG